MGREGKRRKRGGGRNKIKLKKGLKTQGIVETWGFEGAQVRNPAHLTL